MILFTVWRKSEDLNLVVTLVSVASTRKAAELEAMRSMLERYVFYDVSKQVQHLNDLIDAIEKEDFNLANSLYFNLYYIRETYVQESEEDALKDTRNLAARMRAEVLVGV